MTEKEHNWAGNYHYRAARILYPQSVAEIQEIVSSSSRVRGLGSRHSFNPIADTSETLISLKHLNRVIAIDADKQTVTVEGGITYGQLCETLDRAGFALKNMASLPHISVVGACMTSTHGSGVNNGSLATAVSGLEVVTADGQLIQRTRQQHSDEFDGMVVSLGGLGIVTKITLDVVPRFQMRQDVYVKMPFAEATHHFEAIQNSSYSVSLFTRWQDDVIEQVWRKSLADAADIQEMPETFFGASRAKVPVSPLLDDITDRCTEQLGVPGSWYERLPHFRMNFTPSHGEELQAEYYIPREDAIAAFNALKPLGDEIAPLLYISEIRNIAADTLWMSPCYQQPCIAIHFTLKPNWEAVSALLPRIEERLAPFKPRPHWGKLFTLSPENVQARYARLADFRQLLQQYDPQGKFRNAFLETYITG